MAKVSAKAARRMSPSLLRAVIRERSHHLLEVPLQRAATTERPLPRHSVRTVVKLLDVWRERGLPADGEDFKWVKDLLKRYERGLLDDAYRSGETGSVEDLGEAEVEAVRQAIVGRRSIRAWRDDRVPREMLEDVVRAGQWAPCACNLQTLRVLILDDPADAAMIRGEVSGAPAQLVVCQDTRPYDFYSRSVPEKNRWLDSGAAVQTMLLMAHALGLGAVWVTLGKQQVALIRDRFEIPKHLGVVCSIAIGWPAIRPSAPGRMPPEEVIIDHRNQG